jgi:hypothetical protein
MYVLVEALYFVFDAVSSGFHHGVSEPLLGASLPAAILTVLVVSGLIAIPVAFVFTAFVS